jgi:D-glycero-D-manno-heptose 1,7-bisphosphate phosphatase
MSGRPAAFLDRDGTIIHDFHFLDRPEDVVLLPGAAHAVRRLNEAGWPVILVTNQSGIARGFFTMADFDRIQARLRELLAAEGAHLDAEYVCPHHPDISGPCDCRKPGTLLFEQAAIDHDLDVTRSVYIGDRFRDVQPGVTLGGTPILVPNDETPAQDLADAKASARVMRTLMDAVSYALGEAA